MPRDRRGATAPPPTPRLGRATRRRTRPAAGALAAVVVAVVLGAVGATGPIGSTAAQATVEWSGRSTGQASGEPRGEPADDSLPIPEPSTDDADRRADEILADPRFDEPEPGILERIWQWITEQLDKIQIPGMGGAGVGGSEVIGWIFIALLAGLAIFLLSKTRLSRRPRRDDPDFVVDAEVARSEHEWVGEAERFEAAGQWKQALRCRFRALVSALIERGVVRDIPGRTTGEYRVEVSRNAAAIAAAFSGAAELFDRAWYGDEPTGAEENARFRALADEIVLGLEVEAAARATAPPAGVGS